jgi:hypothetical protein
MLALSVGLSLGVARADLYDDYVNSVSKKPFVSFLARDPAPPGSWTGHAYVALGVELDNGLRVYRRVFGFYPVGDDAATMVKAVYDKVDGALDYKLADIAWTVEFRVSIDEKQQAAALSVFDSWSQDIPKYNLLANGGKNCSSLAGEVATAIGLKAPPGAGSSLPASYIRALKSAN